MSAKQLRGREQDEALRILRFLQGGEARCRITGKRRLSCENRRGVISVPPARLAELANANLILRIEDRIVLTEEGHAHLARRSAASEPFLRQHGGIVPRERIRNDPIDAILVDEAESPLAWLARRRGPSGKPLIDAAQFQAGERLRADFTRAGLTPRVTSNWEAPIAQGRRANGGSAAAFSDTVLAAKERVSMTLEVVGPEFAGLLLDVCCFLKGLETVERERGWPQRTAKVVLGLALDRLARHYGIRAEARGPARSPSRYWRAPDARPSMNGS
ncbi:MAG TPA: DUF6456 domain-containing protein [Xanthobacteraceae bacterium]|jgi:hypothetical protein|nr:DUF6456 domain-containing protein [Xanthobacteraceae bacterium]